MRRGARCHASAAGYAVKLRTVIDVLYNGGDMETIHDSASDYGEPGYSTRSGPVLLGDWWCRRADCSYPDTYDDGKKKVHAMEYHYPRVFAFLESEGCELEWYDEWTVVDDRAYRTQSDSYGWQPTAVWNDDIGDYMISGEDIGTWLDWAVNDPRRCLMARTFTDDELAAEGFVERQCDYASGWFAGMDDDPEAVARVIHEREPGTDVLFMLSETSQFYIKFCVYVREAEAEELEDETDIDRMADLENMSGFSAEESEHEYAQRLIREHRGSVVGEEQ